jgi:long-chain acyl-CoA synthetase
LNADVIWDFHGRFGIPICQHYGSSETGAATNHVPAEVLAHPDSVGLPVVNVNVHVVGEDGAPLAAGKEGEVVVRSEAVAKGYVMGKPPGEVTLKNGEFWTGDLGVADGQGYLTVTGRIDEIINVGGFKVSPGEVVRVLEKFPAIREAAVMGVEDAIGGSVVYAAVSLDAVATESEILAYCHAHLADYKIPRRIDILDELPRGHSGTIRLPPTDDFR